MQNSYEVLQFDLIRQRVASFARGQASKNKLLVLTKLSKDELIKELPYLDQAINLHSRFGNLPIDSCIDIAHPVSLAMKGGCLTIEQLEAIAHDVLTAISIKKYFVSVTGCDLLTDMCIQLPDLASLEKEIHRVIAPDLSIFDHASPLLHSLRVQISRLEKEMVRTLGYVVEENKQYLSDEVLTMRDGHYVIPVANAHKHQVRGLALDVSSSGNTTFIEPEILISLSNKMRDLKVQEDEEIRRLLQELSGKVASRGNEVLRQNSIISRFDFLQAKALYCEDIKGHVAEISKEKEISILRARHPLLDQNKVVPNDFFLNEEKRMLIISGPNAGGKTVALKTLGLCVLMFESGLPIPAEQGASIHYIENVYLDIGDSQSIEDNLSTFSAHMFNLAEIYKFTTAKDLLLLDEVGTGTSPKEGESIAYGFIKNLLNKHCFALISSHFEGLKAYALSSEGINNACMLFDDEKLLPTYKLKIGLPGESYGLDVAARFGVNDEVIKSARSYLAEHEEISLSKAIKNLTDLATNNEKILESNKKREAQLKDKEAKLEEDYKTLKEKQNNYLSDIKDIKRQMIEEAEAKIDEIVKSLKGGDLKLHEVIKAKSKLDDLNEVEIETKFSGELQLNDYAEIPLYGVVGRVTRMSGKNIEITTKEGQTYKVEKDRVRKTEKPITKEPLKAVSHVDSIAKSVPLELNIIGYRAAEAQSALEKYLDDCRVRGHKRVRIIHGFGSGVLRKVTTDYLKAHSEFVESFEGAQATEGAGGATIVHLK